LNKWRLILALFALSLFLTPAAIAAGGSAGAGYGGGAGNVQQQVNQSQGQGALGTSGSSGSLPFTGLDLGLLVAGGAVLLVVGATIRRAARRNA
jgi:hypothetical protein